jgi:enoyl-CoA hydratase/carnithine racemase
VPMPPILTTRDGRVGRLTLNRPEAMNAITVELAEALAAGLTALAADCDVIVIRGAGGTFCVGGDFHELERLRLEGPEATLGLFAAFARACTLIGELDVPVVSVVEGHAMAGGFELAQASDLVLVAEDAKLADNHANFAQVPGGGGSQRLPRLVGRQRASAHILTGGRLSGTEAVAWGLAYRAVPAGELDAATDELVERLTGKGKSRAAQARTKRLIRDGLELSLEEGLELERRTVVEHLTGEDAASGIAQFRNRGSST